MLIEKISDDEISMIDRYRRDYAIDDSVANTENFMSTKDLLRVWEEAKTDHLNKIFKDGLTLTKHLEFSKSFEELSNELDDMIDGKVTYGRFERSGELFIDEYLCLLHSKEKLESIFGKDYYNIGGELRKLVYTDTLIKNYYDGDDIDIPLSNGKSYKVRNGCKPVRALGKIAEIFHLEGFEDFRICHSQIINQKNLGGDLTLSIHPLDYMTMSDNDCGWDSCMSWENEGGYRLGTIEMMNSKTVVIAYLAAEEPMNMYPDTWTNKKWRQLFVVDKNAILGVKGYPYQNNDLTCAVLEWLRELVKDNLGWTYDETKKINSDAPIILPDGKEVYIQLWTHYMYNDWGCLKEHYVMFNADVPVEDLVYRSFVDNYIYGVEYSGSAQCMICGRTRVNFTEECMLACTECQNTRTCDHCGEYIYYDDYYYIDDMILCGDCYDNCVHECTVCEEEHYDNYMIEIYVIPYWTPEEQEELRQRIIEREKDPSYRYYNHEEYYDMPEIVTINTDYPQFYTCDTSCLNSFCEKYLKDGCRPSFWKIQSERYTCVYWDDLTDEAKEDVYYSIEKYKEDAFEEKKRFQIRFATKLFKI